MKNFALNIIAYLILFITVTGCSTKKNTWSSRTYHELNTRFNVYFNGQLSYDEGIQNIEKANKEDYSTIIPMFPISRHSNASAAVSNMERTIEKSRKAIKLHSIKAKPNKDEKKANQPKYQLFYNQEEFNPALKEAWLLLAQAEFHKGDFLGASSTFAYIANRYTTNKDMVAQCLLWKARAYAEMGWIYEAEQVLSKVNQDDLKRANFGLFAEVNADLLLKNKQYSEAIPFLELASSKTKNKSQEIRYHYILAQLYQQSENNKKAYEYYKDVIKSNPSYEMQFNAQISIAQLNIGNIESVRKDLLKMTQNPNNKNYLDQLYFALGNTYINNADTTKAIENYKLSIEKSKRNGIDKAQTYIKLADIYYQKKKYILAQPCYEGAGKILSNDHADYLRVRKRAELLSELVTQSNIVILQDSLQALASQPESKRKEVVAKIIEKLIATEKEAEKKSKQMTEGQNPEQNEDLPSLQQIGSAGEAGNWYFYNEGLKQNGQLEFEKKWGVRQLEDNWRRISKGSVLFADDKKETEVEKSETDTTQQAKLDDTKNPEFYLRQIPTTEAKIKKSNAQIASALIQMGQIYKDKINDIDEAIKTYEDFEHRFSSDKKIADIYFNLYIIHTKKENKEKAGFYKTKILTDFPNTKYSKMLSQADYAGGVQKMYKEQDSIYNNAYNAYLKSDYAQVFQIVEFFKLNYPLSTIMPKVLFINALSIGKKQSQEQFKKALDELVKTYPESDVSAMAKDILALMKQGMESKNGTSSGSLLTRRDESVKELIDKTKPKQFSQDRQTKHRLLLICLNTKADTHNLLYNVASYNFTHFLIKNFDLAVSKLDSLATLSITGLESWEEAKWYDNSIASDATIKQLVNKYQIQRVMISEENYRLIKGPYNLDDYLSFQIKEQIGGKQPAKGANKKGKDPR